jgi:hypothetical protein
MDLFGSPNPVGEGRLGGGTHHLQSPPTSSRNHEVHMCGTFHYKCPDFTPVTQFNPPSLRTLRKMGSASGPWLNYRVVQLRSYLLTSWLLLFALSSLNCPRVVVSLVEPAEPSKPRHQQCRANAHNLPVNLHRWTTSPLLNKSQRKIPSAKFALSKTP